MQSKNKNQIGITALYCRLSRDDGTAVSYTHLTLQTNREV